MLTPLIMMNRRCRTVVPKMTGYRVENRHPLLLRTNRQRHLLQGSLGYQRPCSDDGSIGRCPCLASCCPWSLAHWSAGLGGEGSCLMRRGVLVGSFSGMGVRLGVGGRCFPPP